MTFIKRLGLALCLALSFSQFSNAQVVDQVTGNLVNPNSWSGVNYGNLPGDCCTGGPAPLVTPDGTINFSYGHYNVANLIDFTQVQALTSPGVKVTGYNYSWTINANTANGIDSVNANIGLYSAAGQLIQNYNYHAMGTGNYSGTQNFTRPYSLAEARYLQLNFDSFDFGFWAGYYGPTVSNINLRARFTVDPCVANPLYSVDCPGFNNIVTSGNLVPNPGAIATWGQTLNQTFAISTALQHGGLGVQVHGFQWGYDTFSGVPYCANGGLGICFDNRDPLVRTWVNIKDSAGNSLYSSTRDYNDHNYWKSSSYSYTLPQSKNSLTLGNFEFSGQTWDYAGLMNMWSIILYTPDQCVLNPLFSASCTGYQQAYFDQQCSLNPLYNSQCPGYAQAYYDQQCSLNALYDSGCPGYAQAYFNQQCTLNGLYDKLCPNYQSAFLAQQCEINQLYSTQCPGYQQAKLQKDLQDQLAAQTEAASQPIAPSSSSSSSQQSSISETLVDPTKTETVVTTDVGGVELTTTGEISIPTGEPTATKEAIKEAAAAEEKKSEEKKKVDPKALAVARAAVTATERTALSVSENSAVASYNETSTSVALGLGSGITLQGFRPIGIQTEQSEQRENISNQQKSQDNLAIQDRNNQVTEQQETQQSNGPSVRRGGKVEGMEGGPDPSQLATAPVDFNQYLNTQLKDAQFYSSKEIYKNQVVVDNQRVHRQLNGKSDRLHEEMVNGQYTIK